MREASIFWTRTLRDLSTREQHRRQYCQSERCRDVPKVGQFSLAEDIRKGLPEKDLKKVLWLYFRFAKNFHGTSFSWLFPGGDVDSSPMWISD